MCICVECIFANCCVVHTYGTAYVPACLGQLHSNSAEHDTQGPKKASLARAHEGINSKADIINVYFPN